MSKAFISSGTVATNKKARFNYVIQETYEAGIMLTGGEVKSLRAGRATINESYASIEKDGAVYLINAHIAEYVNAKGGFVEQSTARKRKLLLHAKEINKLRGAIEQKGKTLVPLELYFNARGVAKVRIAVAVGKNHADKREDIKKREWNIVKRRILTQHN